MSKDRIQVVMIHGGMTFKKRSDYLSFLEFFPVSLEKRISWKGDFDKKIKKIADVIQLRMPNSENAKFKEWKIWFERHIPLLNNNIILIGNSLGGIFLAKYLSENKLNKNIIATYLIAAPHDNTLAGEDLAGGFTLGKDLSGVIKNSPKTYFLFSKDDEVVPLGHAEKYMKKIPEAHIRILEDKNGHFNIEIFPELIKMVKKSIKK